ncbi:hypothetical protein NQZ68_032822 [Dissostichus eleginoides]|nr:hypothetical protein NQZ68_032822 [Dissostichus eleginoides]
MRSPSPHRNWQQQQQQQQQQRNQGGFFNNQHGNQGNQQPQNRRYRRNSFDGSAHHGNIHPHPYYSPHNAPFQPAPGGPPHNSYHSLPRPPPPDMMLMGGWGFNTPPRMRRQFSAPDLKNNKDM